MKMVDKKGQGLSLSTIILLLLGVVVLVFLIFGFSSGWSNLWGKVTGFGGGSANLDTVSQACELACLSHQTSAFCSEVREVRYGKEVESWKTNTGNTPADIEDNVVDRIKKNKGTCELFSENEEVTIPMVGGKEYKKYPGLSVGGCPNLCD